MKIKKTFQKLTSAKGTLESSHMLKSYLGEKVYSRSGDVVGTLKDIVLKKNALEGIIVKTGFRSKIFIGKDYIKELTPVTMMLSIDPVTSLVGKYVFDADGKKLGVVTELKRSTDANNYQGIYVRKHRFSKPMYIKKEAVEIAKKNIILSETY
ncbi:MAG: PRC-barrel domain-containing protein [Candidatus Woesearchaeota archaeon]